jgi:ABC-type Na+ efflux pump permease subunit
MKIFPEDITIPLAKLKEQVQAIIKQYQQANPKVKVKMTVEDSNEAFEVSRSSPLVHTLASSVRKVLGKPATLLRKTGTGDMNILGKAMNLGSMFTSFTPTLPSTIPQPIQQQILQAMSDFSKQAMTQIFGTADYFSYMAVGMMSFVVMFTAMFSGMSVVWDRRLGFLNKVLSTPVSRGAIIVSKVFSATLRSMFQASIILLIAIPLGFKVGAAFTPVSILGIYAFLFLICFGFFLIPFAFSHRKRRRSSALRMKGLGSPAKSDSTVSRTTRFAPIDLMA